MTIKNELLDELLKDYKKPKDMLSENGILKQLTKALLERAIQGEMTHHLGYPKNAAEGNNTGNSRNGKSKKTLKCVHGVMPLEVPRDQNGTFEPQIAQKGQTRFDGFDDKILWLYSRGKRRGRFKAISRKSMGFPRSHFQRGQFRFGRSPGMAKSPPGSALSDPVSRRFPGKMPGRGARPK